MRFICSSLEWLCRLTHPFGGVIYKLSGNYCHLADLSKFLNDKYDLGVWTKGENTWEAGTPNSVTYTSSNCRCLDRLAR